VGAPRPSYVVAKTDDSTLVHREHGGLITNRGALAATDHELPLASASKGIRYRVLRVAALAMTLTPQDDDTFVNADGSETVAGKHKSLDTDGALLDVESDGVSWVILYTRGTVGDEG
jgi:hypothetical protein